MGGNKERNTNDKKGYNKERVYELAHPKEYDMMWIRCNGPKVLWGTQEVLTPVQSATSRAQPSPRVKMLSNPKREWRKRDEICEFLYSIGRESNWNLSSNKVIPPASARVEELASPIPRKKYDRENDQSGEQIVNSPAPTSARIKHLARAKSVPSDFQPNRELTGEPAISPSALKASASTRIIDLAVYPKRKCVPEYQIDALHREQTAKSPAPSNRLLELAQPKVLTEGYLYERDVIWEIPRSVKRAICSNRLSELSRPNVRASMDHVQFDPNAFKVKELALKGVCPPRVAELAEPLVR